MQISSQGSDKECLRVLPFMRRGLVFTWLLLALGCQPKAEGVTGKGVLVLKGATLIDGTGAPPLPNALVVISDDKIVYAGPAGEYTPEAAAKVIDLSGRYLLPGFIDAHAHVTILSNSRFGGRLDRGATEQTLKTVLGFGITTVRNPAAPTEEGVLIRDRVAEGRLEGPRILTAGRFLNYGDTEGPCVSVRNERDVWEEVQRQAAARVDFIKVYASMPPYLVQAAIEAAHEHGLKVVGHLQTTDWVQAVRLGIDGVTHGTSWSEDWLPEARRREYQQLIRDEGPMRARIAWLKWLDLNSPDVDEVIATLIKHHILVDPTLVAYETKFKGDDPFYVKSPDLEFAPKSLVASWRQGTYTSDWSKADFQQARAAWPKMLQLIKLYYDRGVVLMAGSDLPNPWVIPGVGYHRELELLVESGIPPLQVLKIATRNGAEGLGILNEVGTVEAGKRADLVVLSANPVEDIKNTRRIETVIQSGRTISPDSLLKR